MFLLSTAAALVAIGLPLGLAAWRRRKNEETESSDDS
jgi:NADH:ubiquinone oxidoreductase subunit K